MRGFAYSTDPPLSCAAAGLPRAFIGSESPNEESLSLWRRYGSCMPSLVGWAIAMVFALLLGVVFRAGSLEVAWHVYQGLAIAPNLDLLKVATPIIMSGVVAVALPASQEIAMWINERPRAVAAAALGLVAVALLVELGDRDAYEFVYFQF